MAVEPIPAWWTPQPSLSADQVLQFIQNNAWARVGYMANGTPIIRERGKRVNSGFVISSDANINGLVALPWETVVQTITPATYRRVITYFIPQPFEAVVPLGPMLVSDFQSDDPHNPYTPPEPIEGGNVYDPQIYYQTLSVFTADVPRNWSDFDPVSLELQRKRDQFFLQEHLGEHHTVDITLDSAVCMAELGLDVRIYLPQRKIVGYYRVTRIVQPLGLGSQTWTGKYVGQ